MQTQSDYGWRRYRVELAARRHLMDRGAFGRRTRENSGNSIGYIGREREVVRLFFSGHDTVPFSRFICATADRQAVKETIEPPSAITLFPENCADLRGPALTFWYVQNVVNVTVYDGPYAPDGSAADIAYAARLRDAVPAGSVDRFDRANGYQYATPTGALHGSEGSYLCPDPFRVKARHANGPSADFFNLVHGWIQNMNLDSQMVVAAGSYISRLAIHSTGEKGEMLRSLLRTAAVADPEGGSYPVERRVAFLVGEHVPLLQRRSRGPHTRLRHCRGYPKGRAGQA